MNDLDATTADYEELASPTANEGKGWEPIGGSLPPGLSRSFAGSFDGQGYEIGDLFINRPGEIQVGLFYVPSLGGLVENVGLVNVAVTGGRYVGALVGRSYGTVNNSYSASGVTGKWWVGGLVGYNMGIVDNSYSTGSVTGELAVGGLAGAGESRATVSNSFWDTQTSGQVTSDGGTGKATAEMQAIVTLADMETEGLDAPWDMVALAPGEANPAYTWNIVDGQTYPFLSWQSIV